jgi:hypothetical protein
MQPAAASLPEERGEWGSGRRAHARSVARRGTRRVETSVLLNYLFSAIVAKLFTAQRVITGSLINHEPLITLF